MFKILNCGTGDLMQLYPYLNFNGNCRAAFEFYEKHLGGKILLMMTYSEGPSGPTAPPEWGSAILHARMALGETQVMASDVPPERHEPMRSVYLSISLTGAEEAERVFPLPSDGGEVYMPLQETFWSVRFGMLRDQFGTPWMINADQPGSVGAQEV
jgi:PhnB protein